VAEVSVFFPKLSFLAPAALCGRPAGVIQEVGLPPMLAAQSAFPSGPFAGFHKKFYQLIKTIEKKE
jgi:hypothetical protein